MSRVLVVDDDTAIRTVVAQALRRAGHDVILAASLTEGDAALARRMPDVLVTDVRLPDGDGLDHLRTIAERHPALPVIVLSAQNTLSTAVRAAEHGAYEYLPKPFDLNALAAAVDGALGRTNSTSAIEVSDEGGLPLLGRSPAMQAVYRVIARVISNDLTILISGESGTGKELVARAVHDLGPRRAAPFVAINMAAIPRDLIEAELFGHERGAFTGATSRGVGRFEQAAGGTLFLDEIGDMPVDAQTRLLRVLQSGEFTPVGGVRTIHADVRIVAASNRDLIARVAGGLFREDLFYRLNVVPIALPPLRDRGDDIALLARHFLDGAAAQGLSRRRLGDDALAVLRAHSWPGNVRELENLTRRLAVLARDEVIDADAVRAMLGEAPAMAEEDTGIAVAVRTLIDRIGVERPGAFDDGTLHSRVIAEVERPLIEAMLERHAGNQLRTARSLGINRNTLRKRLDALRIDLPRVGGLDAD
ncbi:nitrogen regulation protein NR(I) [uncultured Sphingomonas sp.]|uniref:nitrogen regulation protein NR(I) n=1 Tax=uncultured Sphingomonas sp. TaxID=158754 RepID=UPI0035CA9BBD